MGGEAYMYFVEYRTDATEALTALRNTEFEAGRYNPATPFPVTPVTSDSPSPGAKHASIEAALEASCEDGTRSILDISKTGKSPDYGIASPIPNARLVALYGTTTPTREMVESNMDFFEDIERGHCVYLSVYHDKTPVELLFAGYSYD